ncbi:hypothetical protein [Pseudomonas sp. ATCC PTA-122608]|uniref:hypothetical protein n=1 Tax=Pseudomonas sp. ATCC PTA-122608 TaxID=1771311 RepID=UPI00117BB21F|nr:hypothetical protein [Pseudomonas sp. ATCC PTA-122608]
MKYKIRMEEVDASELKKNKPVYNGISLLNETGKKRIKDMKGSRLDMVDKALLYAYAFEKHYLNEDGEFDLRLDGTLALEPPSKIECFKYAKSQMKEFHGIVFADFEISEIKMIFFGR